MISKINPNEEYGDVTEELWNYIYERDGGLCQNCGKCGSEAHHIIYRSLGGKNSANNLTLLCLRCHGREHGEGRTRSVEYYQKRVMVNEEKLRKRLI